MFTQFIGKTVTAIALPQREILDDTVTVVFNFSDGSAQGMDVGVRGTYVSSRSGLRTITGVTAFLGHPITAVSFPADADPDQNTDVYDNFTFHTVKLDTTGGSLVIKYLRDVGAGDSTVTEVTPTADGLLTGDYMVPQIYKDFWK